MPLRIIKYGTLVGFLHMFEVVHIIVEEENNDKEK